VLDTSGTEDFRIRVAVPDDDSLYSFVIDRLTDRAEAAVGTSVAHEHPRAGRIAPASRPSGSPECVAGSARQPRHAHGGRSLANRSDAEEVTQATFISAWQGRATFDPARRTIGGWLVAIVRRRVVERLRTAQREQRATEAAVQASRRPDRLSARRRPRPGWFAAAARYRRPRDVHRPAGIGLRAFDVVDVSAQNYDGNPAHQRSVLHGRLTRGRSATSVRPPPQALGRAQTRTFAKTCHASRLLATSESTM
jgi:DNA-directed RNA polymerase specialized sigma24 family protein